jgi:hypothetical protein
VGRGVARGGVGITPPIHHRFGKCLRLGKLFSDLSGNCFRDERRKNYDMSVRCMPMAVSYILVYKIISAI